MFFPTSMISLMVTFRSAIFTSLLSHIWNLSLAYFLGRFPY
jgi:hypothetical protein